MHHGMCVTFEIGGKWLDVRVTSYDAGGVMKSVCVCVLVNMKQTVQGYGLMMDS